MGDLPERWAALVHEETVRDIGSCRIGPSGKFCLEHDADVYPDDNDDGLCTVFDSQLRAAAWAAQVVLADLRRQVEYERDIAELAEEEADEAGSRDEAFRHNGERWALHGVVELIDGGGSDG